MWNYLYITEGRDSAVGIGTSYGLDGPEIGSRWEGVKFSAPLQTGPRAHPAYYTLDTGSFPGLKQPGHGIDHQPLSSVEVKEIVELHVYPLWAFVACFMVIFIYDKQNLLNWL